MNIRGTLILNVISKNCLKVVETYKCCSSYKQYSVISYSYNYNSKPLFHNNKIINNNVLKRNEATVSPSNSYESSATFNDSIFYKLSGSESVAYVQKCLLTVHDSTGLPWWATIALSTFILRSVITFPLAIYQAYITAKVENISMIDMPEIASDLQRKIKKEALENKWTPKEANYQYKYQLKGEWDKLIVAQNCHPAKASLPLWFQIPTWICFSTALRNIAYMLPNNDTDAQIRYLELSVGGFLWIPNLAVPDTTSILPVLLGISNLIIIEIQCMMRMRETTKAQRFATNFFRGFSLILVPISSTVPSCVCLYWSVSSLLGLCQNLLLLSNRVRQGFGIPDTPTTLDRPYSHLAHQIAIKLRLNNQAS